MGHSLAGKRVDDVLVEILGPIVGRNHWPALGAAAPALEVQLFGADPVTSVQVETCVVLEYVGTNNSNAAGSTPVRGAKLTFSRQPGDWVALGAPVLVGTGLLALAPPVATIDAPIAIRARVLAVGPVSTVEETGTFVLGTLWG